MWQRVDVVNILVCGSGWAGERRVTLKLGAGGGGGRGHGASVAEAVIGLRRKLRDAVASRAPHTRVEVNALHVARGVACGT